MSYSKLVEYVRLSPNCSKPRNKKINAIVIHHMAGNATVENCGEWFAQTSTGASSNYGVGTDGRVACYVEEENCAWTTSNGGIDNRAITIEVANCGGGPDCPVSDQALEATIALCVDICRRYGFKLNYTGDKKGNLHMHKWYAATDCPGPYLGSKFPYIAEEVKKRLGVAPSEPKEEKTEAVCAVNVNVLKKGSRGEDVMALQILLRSRGYNGNMTQKLDGIFGPNTEGAVKLFQKAMCIDVDGIVGPITWAKLLGV